MDSAVSSSEEKARKDGDDASSEKIAGSAKDGAGDASSEKNAASSSETEGSTRQNIANSKEEKAAKDCESDDANSEKKLVLLRMVLMILVLKKNENAAFGENAGSAAAEAARKKSHIKVDNHRKIIMRTNPGRVIEAVKILSPNARMKVTELGFEQLLYISLDSIENRDIVVWLLNHCEQSSDNVVIKIGDKILVITKNVEAHIFGVPEGSGESFEILKKKEQGKIKEKVRLMLGLPAKAIMGGKDEETDAKDKEDEETDAKEDADEKKKGRRVIKVLSRAKSTLIFYVM